MAKKSKTQRAKASAARSARKEARELEEQKNAAQEGAAEVPEKTSKLKTLFKKDEAQEKKAEPAKSVKKDDEKKKKKKERFKFFKEVRSEMKRVTWPTKQEVLRWSVVVVAALLFFGIYVAILDNGVVTPLLYLISGLRA